MSTHLQTRDSERLGGSLPVWLLLTLLGAGLLAFGANNEPRELGALLIIGGGVILGLAYAEIITRLPTITHRVWASLAVVTIASVLVIGVLAINASTVPVPPQDQDALLEPNVTAG